MTETRINKCLQAKLMLVGLSIQPHLTEKAVIISVLHPTARQDRVQ